MRYSTMKRYVCVFMTLLLLLPLLCGSGYASSAVETGKAIDSLDSNQLRAINMLNYLTALLQDIHESKGNKVYLQEAFDALKDNTHPDIDQTTQVYITDIMSTLNSLRMLAVKRERLQYIYEQEKAMAMKEAIPDSRAILNVVQSTTWVKALISLTVMAADSVAEYLAASSTIDLQYLLDGWDLDDQEVSKIDQSQIDAFNYMVDIVRQANLHGEDALLAMNSSSVKDFIKIKNTENVHSRIQALLDNQKTYAAYGGYWILLARTYYELGQYEECLNAFECYESLNMDIFRNDYEYAGVIPVAIAAALETMPEREYITFADKRLNLLISNSDNNQWDLRYFAAMTYLDLYAKSQDNGYLKKSFDLVKNNINYLLNEQNEQNKTYMADVVKVKTDKMKEKDKKEAEQVNKAREERRKKELPPVYEPLWLNCSLLLTLSDLYNIPAEEKSFIDSMLHPNGEALFLVKPLDDICWFDKKDSSEEATGQIELKKGEILIPAKYICEDCRIVVTLTEGDQTTVFEDWVIDKVDRKEKGELDTFTATFKSKTGSSHKYADEGMAVVTIYPKNNADMPAITATYKTVSSYVWFVQSDFHFESVTE